MGRLAGLADNLGIEDGEHGHNLGDSFAEVLDNDLDIESILHKEDEAELDPDSQEEEHIAL